MSASDEPRAKCVECGSSIPELPGTWTHIICDACEARPDPVTHQILRALTAENAPVLAAVLAELSNLNAGDSMTVARAVSWM